MHTSWYIVSVAVAIGGVFALWGTSNNPMKGTPRGPSADLGSVTSSNGLSIIDTPNMSVLYVMEPINDYSFEQVGIDPYTNETLLPWVMGLTDAFTSSGLNPRGENLMVSMNDL